MLHHRPFPGIEVYQEPEHPGPRPRPHRHRRQQPRGLRVPAGERDPDRQLVRRRHGGRRAHEAAGRAEEDGGRQGEGAGLHQEDPGQRGQDL